MSCKQKLQEAEIESFFSDSKISGQLTMAELIGQNPELVERYTALAKKGTKLPVLAKMTPNLANMEIPAIAAINGGVSEIPVEIHMKKLFADTLSFYVDWDGIIYGFVRGRKEISEKLSGFEVKRITISDWDDKFQLLFEGEEATDEIPFFVTGEEVRELLENCRRVPEQNVPKRK